MANHVYWTINFEKMNHEAEKKLKEILGRIREPEEGSYYRWLSDIFVYEGSPFTYEDTNSRSWCIDNIGAKWCYIEDIDEGYISGTSAWDAPEGALEYILLELSEVDDNIITTFTYEDEMPNFYGASVYLRTEVVDDFHDDYEDLIRFAQADLPDDLADKFDFEEMEWKDEESEETFREVMYEVLAERQMSVIDGALESLQEEK